ncbi:MAG: DNA primase [Candidatus Brocadiia bacterium]
MRGKVPEHVIQQIVHSADIVRIISRYTDLKKRGNRFWGLCPFHKEKTPSFTVDPEEGLYYCFGCGQGGNIFTFLKDVEGLEFQEALRQLAQDAGVDLSRYKTEDGPSRDELKSLRQINELASTFYEKCLEKAGGSDRARSYLKERQINEKSIEKWRIGYAPEGWDHLLNLANRRSISPSMLEEAGLVVPRSESEGYYDRFRNRLMFPVRDRNARVIGFGGRALAEDQDAKYLNSPAGPIFDKSRCLYGFCEARDSIRSNKEAVIVEGYTDVIMSHQFGLDATMAVLGTALTEKHARTLSKLCQTVHLVFDPDEAGIKSATRSIEVLLAEDIEPRIVQLPEGLDPCDFLLKHGPDVFRERINEDMDFLEFRLKRASEQYDMNTVNGRSSAFEDLAEMALEVQNEARRDILVRTIAREVGVSEQSAFAYLERTWNDKRRYSPPREGHKDVARLSAEKVLREDLLGLILANKNVRDQAVQNLDLELLPESPERTLLQHFVEYCREQSSPDAAGFINSLENSDLVVLATRTREAEKRRKATIKNSPPLDRYQEYIEYLQRKGQNQSTRKSPETESEEASGDSLDRVSDERIRDFQKRLKQEDQRIARIWKRNTDD